MSFQSFTFLKWLDDPWGHEDGYMCRFAYRIVDSKLGVVEGESRAADRPGASMISAARASTHAHAHALLETYLQHPEAGSLEGNLCLFLVGELSAFNAIIVQFGEPKITLEQYFSWCREDMPELWSKVDEARLKRLLVWT